MNGCYGARVESVDDFAQDDPIHHPFPKVIRKLHTHQILHHLKKEMGTLISGVLVDRTETSETAMV